MTDETERRCVEYALGLMGLTMPVLILALAVLVEPGTKDALRRFWTWLSYPRCRGDYWSTWPFRRR